ncbi:inorganic diphosphatase [Hymenobacter sp. B81]|uniref:inorganic diphosphatase n=1 Tax=Hymenobacter sp. B81 TaxID=3344878 RepID=UPI0037DD22CC
MRFRLPCSVVAHLTGVGCATLLLAGCGTPRYDELPTYSEERHLLQVVVETPAGSNHPQRYSLPERAFVPEQHAGTDRLVQFLPYPVNAGFIPATRRPGSASTSFRPQSALVLAESQPAGTVLEVVPLALLLLDNAGELESVVVTVPARPSQQVLPVGSWDELNRQYPAVRELLRLWYQHHAGPGRVRVMGWRNEQAAAEHIRKVRLPQP